MRELRNRYISIGIDLDGCYRGNYWVTHSDSSPRRGDYISPLYSADDMTRTIIMAIRDNRRVVLDTEILIEDFDACREEYHLHPYDECYDEEEDEDEEEGW